MTCGNLIQDFHNIEVIDKSLKEPLDIFLFPFPFLNKHFSL